MFKKIQSLFLPTPGHDPLIEGVRGASVLMIILFHVVTAVMLVSTPEQAKTYVNQMPFYFNFFWHGDKGVDIFFFLSTLVLGIPLFKKNSMDKTTLFEFYKKRFYRIYPLYVVTLILYSLSNFNLTHFIHNLFMISPLVYETPNTIPVSWSLYIEVYFYLILPFLMLFIFRFKKPLLILLSLILLFQIGTLIVLINHPDLYKHSYPEIFFTEKRGQLLSLYGYHLYESPLVRVSPLLIGLLAAYLFNNKGESIKQFINNSINRKLIFILITFLLLFIPTTLPLYREDSIYNLAFNPYVHFIYLAFNRLFFTIGILFLFFGLWYSPTFPFKILKNIFNNYLFIPFAKMSYPIYLLHYPLVALSAALLLGTTKDFSKISQLSPFQTLGIFVLTCLLSLIISIPFHLFIEVPFINKNRKLKHKVNY